MLCWNVCPHPCVSVTGSLRVFLCLQVCLCVGSAIMLWAAACEKTHVSYKQQLHLPDKTNGSCGSIICRASQAGEFSLHGRKRPQRSLTDQQSVSGVQVVCTNLKVCCRREKALCAILQPASRGRPDGRCLCSFDRIRLECFSGATLESVFEYSELAVFGSSTCSVSTVLLLLGTLGRNQTGSVPTKPKT